MRRRNEGARGLEKVEEDQKKHKLNEPFQAFEGFEGPVKKRAATDKWWMLGVLICFLYLGVHSILTIIQGKSYRLYSGLDFRSKPCGLNELKPRRFLYFPLPNVNVNITMCVDKCPEDTGRRLCLYHPDGVQQHEADEFCYTSIQTQYDGRYCVPREMKTKQTVDSWLYSWENVYRRFLGDVSLTADIMVCAFIVEILLLVLTLLLLGFSCTLGCCVWVGIIVAINALNLMALFCYLEYLKTVRRRCFGGKDSNNCGGARSSLFYTLTIVFFALGVTYLVVVLYFCRKIQFVLNALKKSIFIFKRMRENKLNILFGRPASRRDRLGPGLHHPALRGHGRLGELRPRQAHPGGRHQRQLPQAVHAGHDAPVPHVAGHPGDLPALHVLHLAR